MVGAGVGGLCLAGRLARAGYAVTLLEKNDRVGGRMQSLNPDGAPEYRYDTGPSLLLFPQKYKEAFEALGGDIEDHVEVRRVDPAYRAHYGDGTSVDLLYDVEKMRAQVEELEPGAGGRFVEWLGKARVSLDLGVRAFIEQDCRSALDFVNPARVLELALKVNPVELLFSQFNQMGMYFKEPKLKALFSFQELYVGLSPYNAPGVFSLLAATELTDAVWYPMGGFQKVRDGLLKLVEEAGVEVRLNTAVEKIEVEETAGADGVTQRRATGVRLASGETLAADVVVANPDIPVVFDDMLDFQGAAEEAKRMEDMDYSASVIAYYWAVEGEMPDLLHHNVFLSSDYKGSWDRCWRVSDFDAPRQHNFYVHNPVYTDPTCAPEGCHSIMVLLPVANLGEAAKLAAAAGERVPDRQAFIDAGREAVLRRFEADGHGDLRGRIKHEFVYDPETWKNRVNIKHGAVFGLSHGLLQLACFRPPTQSGIPGFPETPKVSGLHYVGASTRPGNGVPLVMMGAAVTYDNIIEEQGYGSATAPAAL